MEEKASVSHWDRWRTVWLGHMDVESSKRGGWRTERPQQVGCGSRLGFVLGPGEAGRDLPAAAGRRATYYASGKQEYHLGLAIQPRERGALGDRVL